MEQARTALAPSPGAVEPAVADGLFAALYSDLHRMAQRQLARGGSDMTLGTTTLLHEAYLDMASRHRVFVDRRRLLAYASRVMHARIVDHFRRVHTLMRGSSVAVRPLRDDLVDPQGSGAGERARVGQALASLASAEPQLADIVELHFYGGFTYAEIAAMRGLSLRTVQRLWGRARVYLRDAIDAAAGGSGPGAAMLTAHRP